MKSRIETNEAELSEAGSLHHALAAKPYLFFAAIRIENRALARSQIPVLIPPAIVPAISIGVGHGRLDWNDQRPLANLRAGGSDLSVALRVPFKPLSNLVPRQ